MPTIEDIKSNRCLNYFRPVWAELVDIYDIEATGVPPKKDTVGVGSLAGAGWHATVAAIIFVALSVIVMVSRRASTATNWSRSSSFFVCLILFVFVVVGTLLIGLITVHFPGDMCSTWNTCEQCPENVIANDVCDERVRKAQENCNGAHSNGAHSDGSAAQAQVQRDAGHGNGGNGNGGNDNGEE